MPTLYSNVTTEPATEPISLAEAKTHLRVDLSDDNDLITLLIQVAREAVENRTGRSLIEQTRTLKLDYFPCSSKIILPHGPVTSITSITYYDSTETPVILSSGDYWTDFTSGIPYVKIKNSWPSTFDMPNAVTIVYVAGYGDSSTSVPAQLRQAMFLILGHLYQNRESVIVSTQGVGAIEIPYGAEALMAPYVLENSVFYGTDRKV